MKAFLAAIVAMIVIAVGASFALDELGHDSASASAGDAVRLSEPAKAN